MAYSMMFVMESEMAFEKMSAKPSEMGSVRVSEMMLYLEFQSEMVFHLEFYLVFQKM